ncbi:A/G-specific adenine glycosylase [Paenisporosarcina sp. TG-14]|uniref:A/G-specific adenine glycosylase n=1 Tax=Paenisporosarcina sp. TG-14 TaxID=1231057 RepID=UPI0003634248|nr:A/G-specific adenine glycosylase [Paenisporosarcina sp. TG-14]
MNEFNKITFRKSLIDWYLEEKRNLPWRETNDPYKIWVSEIMLQQTRVDTVIPYYNRFIDIFPTMEDLANANEEKLLKQWEGLGYYSRARNLQAGVREVVETYNSIVPTTRNEISSLKGVGPYTAGAILSIAYGKPEHAVDGNVMRVLSRVLLIKEDIAKPKTRKTFELAVTEIIDSQDPSSFNQGLMELGAVICTPTSPKCLLCPVRDNCTAYYVGEQNNLPVKTKNKKTKAMHYDIYVVQNDKKQFLMEKRAEKGLLANMYQFPMIELATKEADTIPLLDNRYGIHFTKEIDLGPFKHVFSHLTWEMNCFVGRSTEDSLLETCKWLTIEEIKEVPMPVPMLKIWQAYIERGN